MFRLLDLFGKSTALRVLDDALRAVGVHPLLVPEPVKLTLLKLTRHAASATGREEALGQAARLFAFCMLGHEGFARANGPDAARHAAQRLDDAIAAGDSLDARLVLLSMHAGLISPEIADLVEIGDR